MRNEEIILDLRRRIVAGEFQPGNALPRRHELLASYQASNETVQRAVNQLAQEGFINTRGSKGMFVSSNPPNLFRFGVVLPPNHREMETNGDTQWGALERAIEEISRERPEYSFSLYHIDLHCDPDLPEFRRLVEDLELGLIAGVIFSSSVDPQMLLRLKPFRVVLHSPAWKEVIPATVMRHDYRKLAQLAVARLLQRGASRVAILLAARTRETLVAELEQHVRESGVICRPEWVHGIHHLPEGPLPFPYRVQLHFDKQRRHLLQAGFRSCKNLPRCPFNINPEAHFFFRQIFLLQESVQPHCRNGYGRSAVAIAQTG